MKGYDLFGVIVRTCGLVSIIYAIGWLAVGFSLPGEQPGRSAFMSPGALLLASGLVCFFAANQIVWLAYRTPEVRHFTEG
jgi:hypothetical protein